MLRVAVDEKRLEKAYETKDREFLLRRYQELYYKSVLNFLLAKKFNPLENFSGDLDKKEEFRFLRGHLLRGSLSVVNIEHFISH